MKPIQLPAILSGFSSKSDGGASLRFATNELTADDFKALKDYHNQFGYVLFSPNPFNESDIPKESAENKDKTPSKRIRAVLFILWKQRGSNGDFEVFYRSQTEKYIEYLKTKIDK